MSKTQTRQRLAAILAADAVGYSRLMSVDDHGTVAALDAARAVFRKHILASQGRVVDMAGDSVLAAFETATGAVSAALAIQTDLEAAIGAVPAEKRLLFRIGVHLGDVIEKADGTIYGDGVNAAARLQALAPAGGIVISEAVRGSVKNRVAARFVDMGKQAVKNIAEPVRAFKVQAAGGEVFRTGPGVGRRRVAWITGAVAIIAVLAALVVVRFGSPFGATTSTAGKTTDRVLAVLPFRDMRAGDTADNFADGLREELLDALTHTGNWRLVSRTSGSQFREGNTSIKAIATELGATHIIEGSIRREEKTWRLTAQLIDAASDTHLISFATSLSTEFPVGAVQRTFASSIAARVRFMLGEGEWAYSLAESDMPPKAALLFRQGAMEIRYGTQADAKRFLNDARTLAPNNARVLALLALSEVRGGLEKTAVDNVKAVEDMLQEAERLSPESPDTAIARGWLQSWTLHNPAEALSQFDRLTKSQGNYDWQLGKAFALRDVGKTEQALIAYERATAMDGYALLPVANVGMLRIGLRRLDDGMAYLDRARQRWPLFPRLGIWSMQARLIRYGDVSAAKHEMQEWQSHFRVYSSTNLLAQTIFIQLALLEGDVKAAAEALRIYPDDCLERTGYPTMLGRIDCKAVMLPALFALQGNRRELGTALEQGRVALEDAVAKTPDDDENLDKRISLAELYAFAGERTKAMGLLENLEKRFDAVRARDSQANEIHSDLAIGWLWVGNKARALAILKEALTENFGANASIVARDPIWCALYDDPGFTRLLAARGQQVHKHAVSCPVVK